MSKRNIPDWFRNSIPSLFGGGLDILGGVLSSVISNIGQRKLQREQNAYNKRESELAYRRSLPVNQVSNLQAAGMSKAAALNAVSGGNSYTPMPSASREYSTPDFGGVFSNIAQMMLAERQLQETKSQNKHGRNMDIYENNRQEKEHEERMKVLEQERIAKELENAKNRLSNDDDEIMRKHGSLFASLNANTDIDKFVKDLPKELQRPSIIAYVRAQHQQYIASADSKVNYDYNRETLQDRLTKSQYDALKSIKDYEQFEQLVNEFLSEDNVNARAARTRADYQNASLEEMEARLKSFSHGVVSKIANNPDVRDEIVSGINYLIDKIDNPVARKVLHKIVDAAKKA